LDGYVQGPVLDNSLHRYSFDHHKGCIRLITTATCEQVRDAILLGLDPERYTIFVNDVDTDTALAVWALRNPVRLRDQQVGQYIACAGLLDAHGGGYPLVYVRHQVEWLGVPETEARISGEYEQLTAQGLSDLIDRIGERFEALLRGEAPSEEQLRRLEQKAEFQRLFDGDGWTLVQATDPHVLFDLYEQGIERIVTCRPQKDGSWAYTVARRSDFVDGFDVPAILTSLDAVEKGWGGGSTIGGAPRHADGSRSRLPPQRVFELVEACVRAQNKR
jgi:hypothetical protein